MNSIIAPAMQARAHARRRIEREVSARYAAARKRAGIWGRLLIWLKIQQTVTAELKRKFPPHALYGRHSLT